MGGSIAVHTALRLPRVLGLVVLDVVEGTAIEALPSMRSILRRRPQSFDSLEDAIEWSLRSSMIRNRDSARVSMPSQIVRQGDRFVWRIDLSKTEPFWQGTFISYEWLICRMVPRPFHSVLASACSENAHSCWHRPIGQRATRRTDARQIRLEGPAVGWPCNPRRRKLCLFFFFFPTEKQDPVGTANALKEFSFRNRFIPQEQ
jgi:hypothetical protein